MDDTAKVALAAGLGIFIGKAFGGGAWWLLGAATAVFIMKSPSTQKAISSGAKTAYYKIKK